MKEKIKELQEMLETIKSKKSAVLVEKSILEKSKAEIKDELSKLNIKPEDLDNLITELETKINQELETISIPKELLDL